MKNEKDKSFYANNQLKEKLDLLKWQEIQKGNNISTLKNQSIIRKTGVDDKKQTYQQPNYVESNNSLPKIQSKNENSQPSFQFKLNRLIKICQDNKIIYYTFQQLKQKIYDLVILFENVLFYCKSQSIKELEENILQIEGKLYSTQFDKNKNPKYKIQQGQFQVDLIHKKFVLIGKGIEYLGKSNIQLQENSEKLQDEANKTKYQEFRSQSQPAKKKIIIKEEGIIVNNKPFGQYRRQFQKLKIWCKYNQSFNDRDEQILITKKWLTSSIIDSFVFYLNLESEKEYFKQKKEDYKKQINRILFLPTSLTTNFGIQYDFQKAQYLFQQELLEYQEMNFQLNLIYNKIGIPINKNNIHWQFLLFDYEKKCVELFDSLSCQFDQNLIETLAKLLNLENCKQKRIDDFGKQQNSYACGYYVCTFMYYQFQLQFNQNLKYYPYDEAKITKQLLDVIKDQENQ